jgi:hypothetical protein
MSDVPASAAMPIAAMVAQLTEWTLGQLPRPAPLFNLRTVRMHIVDSKSNSLCIRPEDAYD